MFSQLASLVLLAALQDAAPPDVLHEGSALAEGVPAPTAVMAGGFLAARAEDEAPVAPPPATADFALDGGWGLARDRDGAAGGASTGLWESRSQPDAEAAAPLFPLPFTPDFTRGGGWGVAIGLGVEYENAYVGSDEYEFELDPALAIQWREGNHLFSWEGLELSWTTRPEDQWYVQVDLGLDEGREEDDSDDGRLDGLEDRDDEFVGTGEVRYAFDGDWRNYVGTRISVGDADYGALGFLFVGHRFGDRQDGGGTEAFLFATFADSNNLNRSFGINPMEAAASGLAETDLDGGYRSSGLRLVDRRFVNEHVQIVSGLEFQYFGSDVRSSPIAREDYVVEVELAVLYYF